MLQENKTVTIVLGPDCALEAMAIRSNLEYFGFTVVVSSVGRPNDMIKILQGDSLTNLSNYLIFCFHGRDGKFLMPKLAKELYHPAEPQGDFAQKNITQYAKLSQQHIVVTGCTLGQAKMARSFLDAHARTFIGSRNYPEGNAVVLFVSALFYHLSKGESYEHAYAKAKAIDQETELFEKYNGE